jgi:uncharacterized membrane protein YccC
VLRFSLAASVAYGLATLVGFQHPVWAPIEALIVSQESIGETFDSIQERLVGTLIGVAVALLVGIFGRTIELPLILQIAISVTVCAMATSRRPTIRVCLWTCPLVLVMALTRHYRAGRLDRVSQVLLGAMVGEYARSTKGLGAAGTVFCSGNHVQPNCHQQTNAGESGFHAAGAANEQHFQAARAQLDAEMPLRQYSFSSGEHLLALLCY